MHKSSSAERTLFEIQKKNFPDLKPVQFIQDVKTRWNSTYLMLERLKRIGQINVSDFATE